MEKEEIMFTNHEGILYLVGTQKNTDMFVYAHNCIHTQYQYNNCVYTYSLTFMLCMNYLLWFTSPIGWA